MDPQQRLAEEEAIKRLKARYFRCMDTKNWPGFVDVFTEDARLKFDHGVGTDGFSEMNGRAAIAENVPKMTGTAQTVHHGHMPEIDILSETEARGIWAMEDIVDYGTTLIQGWGHYHETYRKEEGQWRIASVHLTRLRLTQFSRDKMVL